MKKSVLPLLLTLALVLGLCAAPAAAAPEEFVIEDGVLTEYNGPGGAVTIPEGVIMISYNVFEEEDIYQITFPESLRYIDNRAFRHCTGLREITLPDALEWIGPSAFQDCTGLRRVTMGSGLRGIEAEAFSGCVSLIQLDLPQGLGCIQDQAFQDCVSLTSVIIPEGVTEIGSRAFDSCTSLEEIQLPSTLEDCNREAFRNTPWLQAQGDFVVSHDALLLYQGKQDEVVIPDGVKKIAAAAFAGHRLHSVRIPGSVRQIERAAFSACPNLERVVLEEGVEVLSDYAFYHCYELTEVSIPQSVTTFGAQLFRDTPWQEGQGDFAIVNGVLLGYEGDGEVATIPDGVREIAPAAFSSNGSPTEVTIPASVEAVGDDAFNDCYALERVNYPPTLTEIGRMAFRSTPWLDARGEFPEINGTLLDYQGHQRDVVIPGTIKKLAEGAFFSGERIVSATVPGSVKEIDPDVFNNLSYSLRYLVLEEGVERIGPLALNLDSIEVAVLPASLQEIAPDAFPEGVTLYAPEGSYAQEFAKTQGWTVYPAGTSLTGFSDVGNQTYCTFPVLWAVKEGITKGTSETTFSPDRPCTQEEAATLLLRILGYAGDPAVFFQGISGGTYDPKAPCTRAKAVTFLFNCLDGYYDGTGSGFADVPDNAPYVGAVRWAVTHNITQGTGPDTFSPERICTRGQIVTFLYRALA